MPPKSETVGARIRALRHDRAITQDQLAMACGVSRSAVAQWETDRAGQLRENIPIVAAALGVSIETLLTGRGEDPAIQGDELAMLRLYRVCEPDDRAFLLRTARKLAATNVG